MTANRRAELQRKLGMVPVPKPPAGLADRIKNDIPNELMVDADKERRRLRSAVAFNVRVAASIILLVSSVYLALNLVTRRFGPMDLAKSNTAADTVTATAAPPAPVTQLARVEPAETPVEHPVVPASAPKVAAPKLVAQAQPAPVMSLQDADAAANKASAKETETEERANPSEQSGVVAGVTAAAPAAMPAPPPPPPPALDGLSKRARADDAPAIEIAEAPFDAAKLVVRVPAGASVVFDDDAVASWHAIAANLYEVALRPGDAAVIATVQTGDGTRVIRRGDLRGWEQASRRTKIAALEAALAAGVKPADVAAKARAAGLDDVAAAAEKRQR